MSDPRSMNHMDPETKRVHLRIEEWAAWAKDGAIGPGQVRSPAGRLLEQKVAAGAQGAGVGEMPEQVAKVDAAICKLSEGERSVIRQYYLRWAAVEVMARHLRMRVGEFNVILRRARWKIGHLIEYSV